MKYLILVVSFAISSSLFAQKTKLNKAFADSLINQWNIRFNSDKPESIQEILAKNVVEVSGEDRFVSIDSVMENFVKKRMPVISELKALNEFCSLSENMIYTAGGYKLRVAKSKTESFIAYGNYTFIWRKQKDKTFKIEYMHIESVPR